MEAPHEHESELLRDICDVRRHVNCRTLEEVIHVAVELAREGREGRKVGTVAGPISTRSLEDVTVVSKKAEA